MRRGRPRARNLDSEPCWAAGFKDRDGDNSALQPETRAPRPSCKAGRLDLLPAEAAHQRTASLDKEAP